ncbi:glycosidase, partial [Clavibacter californiensis]
MESAALSTDPAAVGDDRSPDLAPADAASAPPIDRDALAADLRPLAGDDADALADALAADLGDTRPRSASAASAPADLDLAGRTGGVCYVDRYADDLRGLVARIPALRDLGLTHLQITPVAARADHGADADGLLAPGVRVRAGLG